MTRGSLSLSDQCRYAGLPVPIAEYYFAKPRRWRFDWAFPELLLAVEQEGGVWTGGRHTRGKGFENDCIKYAEALCRGWRVLRVTTDQIKSGQALGWLERILRG